MKKIIIGIGLFLGSLLTGTLISYAAPSVSAIFQGGTGTTTAPTSQLIYGGTGPVYQSVPTTTVACSGSTTCSDFTVIGSSPITISSSGGSGTVTSITLTGLDGVSPITTTGTIIAQISTSSVPTLGNLPYWTGVGTPSTLGTIATSAPTFNGGLTTSGTAGAWVGGSGYTISISAPVSIANGGTNATSFSPSRTLVYFDGTRLVSTSTEPLYVGALIATSTLTNSGIGTTTPWGTFAINPVAAQASNAFVVGSSTATSFIVNNSRAVGIGTTSPAFNNGLYASSTIASYEEQPATSTSQTIDFSTGNSTVIYAGTSAVTVTFSNMSRPGISKRVEWCNSHGGTPAAITWPNGATLIWAGGTTPTASTANDKCDIYSFITTVASSSPTGGGGTVKAFGAATTGF